MSSWVRDYIYIPLGGNRVSKIKWLRNILVVWLLTGIWHGAEWNFLIWGFYFGIILLLEKFVFGKFLEKIPSIFSRFYTLFIVMVSFIIFNGESTSQIFDNISGLFGLNNVALVSAETIYYLKSYLTVLIIGIVASTPFMKIIVTKEKLKNLINVLEPIYLILILIISTSYIVDGSFNPFLYFRF